MWKTIKKEKYKVKSKVVKLKRQERFYELWRERESLSEEINLELMWNRFKG